MIVERLGQADLPTCMAIAAASFDHATFDLEEEARRDMARIWIARSATGAMPSAFLLAWCVADELHVLTVAALPEERRRGFGRALVRAALEHARSSRVALVLLEVRRDNDAAFALYRAEGFSITSMRRGYYADGVDAIEMSLRLDPATGVVVPTEDETIL